MMSDYDEMDCPLADAAKMLRDIPDRGEPCDRETATDGTEIILENDDM